MKKYTLVICLFFGLSFVKGQHAVVYDFPQEKMYAQLNTTLLFPGEYLYYKLYCLDKEKNNLSALSTIAYVELIGATNEIVFKHRVLLKDGKGFNDFFIPTTLPSGNYKLVAYTQWMQNTGIADVFVTDLKVINPYLSEKLKTIKATQTRNYFNENSKEGSIDLKTSTFSKIDFQLDKLEYKKREKIGLKLVNNIAELGYGSYSVSVRRIADILTFEKPKAQTLINSNFKKNGLIRPNNMLPPEREGYFITGTVLNATTNKPAPNLDVSISIPGKDFYFTVVTTAADGSFSFTVDPEFPGDSAIVQLLGKAKKLYTIKLSDASRVDYSSFNFPDFEIDFNSKKAILDRSLYNQIENGYYSVKPDTLIASLPANSFVRYEKGVVYNLDDYKRFQTLTEVFTEIMKIVYTARDKDGSKVVKVVERKFTKPTDDLAMLFIDGVFVPDHAEFLAFDALKVDYIKFVRNGYVFGKRDYQGVILVTTKQRDYKPTDIGSFITENELFIPRPQKQYFKQEYTVKTEQKVNRIPDYRLQLLWHPELELSSSEQQLEFYTSDVTGNYEVVLEGFARNGAPISAIAFFKVID